MCCIIGFNIWTQFLVQGWAHLPAGHHKRVGLASRRLGDHCNLGVSLWIANRPRSLLTYAWSYVVLFRALRLPSSTRWHHPFFPSLRAGHIGHLDGEKVEIITVALNRSCMGFPGDSVVKNPPADAGDSGLIPGSRRSPGGGNGNPLQFSCLGNPMDRGTWQVTVHGVTKELDKT